MVLGFIVSMVRWVAAGVLAAVVVGFVDSLGVLPGPEDASARGLFSLTIGLHSLVGALVGLVVGLSSLLMGGLTGDGIARSILGFFRPLRSQRARYAAAALVGPVVGLGLLVVLFGVNLRFFGFNNQRLAAVLLALLTLGLVLAAFLTARALVGRLEPLIEDLADRWPRVGDAPIVWLAPGVGLFVGAVVAGFLRRQTVISETWEALDLAPYVGLLITLLLAVMIEVGTRRRRALTLSAAGLAIVAGCASWVSALTAELGGVDNDHLRRHSDVARLYLTLAERFTDRDRDGFSPHFGHGDCDDSDDLAYPGSSEGNDCGPDVALDDDAEFEARMRGPAESPPPVRPVPRVEPAARPVKVKPVKVDEANPPEVAPLPSTPEPPPIEAKPPPKPRYNVVLITIDTVRADHMHFAGYERKTTDHMDELAKRSAVFENAYSPSNMTPAAIPALLSGRYTTELYRDDSHFIRFDERNTFVAERLAAAGVQTRAVVTHWYFEKRKRSGLYQGFDDWQVVGTRWGKEMEGVATSKLVADEGIAQLGKLNADEPYFLWLHFLDPHKWYIFHDGFEKRWGRKSKDRYDHEIAFTDHHIGRVLKAISGHASADQTAIMITSDHGEAFGEHKTAFHGFSVYEDQLRVPLIVHVPGQEPQRIKKRVGLIDLTPTVLDLMGVALPKDEKPLQGRSWRPDIEGRPLPQRLIYSERPRGPHSGGMRALIDGDWKLIWRAAGNRYELYDLVADPGELDNRIKKDADTADRLIRTMATLQKRALDNQGKVRRR
ncbi:MAG: choline-sulfatase [Myxococcota bacterium]|jgi:choline-sulfatase